MLLGYLDPHEPELEELGKNVQVELRGLVHGRHMRSNFRLGKLSHGFPKEFLFLRELGEGNGYFSYVGGHEDAFREQDGLDRMIQGPWRDNTPSILRVQLPGAMFRGHIRLWP
jgi:hypothetical protein